MSEYVPYRFQAFKTVIRNPNAELIHMLNGCCGSLELDVSPPRDQEQYNHNHFQKYACIRSIQDFSCENPIILYAFYNKYGHIDYAVSTGKTRWALWHGTRDWDLPVLLIDHTFSNHEQYFDDLEPYNEPVTFRSEPPNNYRTNHKFYILDDGEDWIGAEKRLLYEGVHNKYWHEYQVSRVILPQLNVFYNDELILQWGFGDDIVSKTISNKFDLAKVWLDHLEISC